MATWPKHLRPRWRYLAVILETPADVDLGRDEFQAALWEELRHLLGDTTSARVGMEVVRFRHRNGTGEAMIRVARNGVEDARAILATLDRVGDTPIRLEVSGVSGTIRACEENYLGTGLESTSHNIVTFEDVEVDAITRGEAVDIRVDSTPIGATTSDIT